MRRLAKGLKNARSSLWFTPGLMVAGAVVLSMATLRLDATLDPEILEALWWLFGGTGEGAQTLLSVLAGSLITVIAVVFSVTIIAIQQASTQYSPRVMRNFTSDRVNQLVLGAYFANFAYALLVLRQVRQSTPEEAAYIPALSIFVAMLLALVSLAMLIYFIDHVTKLLQVSHLLSAIRRETDRELEQLFPETFGRDSADPRGYEQALERARLEQEGEERVVRTEEEGYLRQIDERQLGEVLRSRVRFAAVQVQVGTYVQKGSVLLRAWSERPLGEDFDDRVRAGFLLDRQRSIEQDPLFGIRQLVDIALKALSPGINDPTTAEQSLEQLVGVIGTLLGREIPNPERALEGGTRVLFKVPGFFEYVDAAFGQVRRAAAPHVHVTLFLLRSLRALIEKAPTEGRAEALRHFAREVLDALSAVEQTHADEGAVRRAALSTLSAGQEAPTA